ncbi:MAG: hypothetical protein M5R42_07745 [Rhodocyclaceae bacterium]|nr:hypothetical protein [Rhodocyclaceae bacterium]
MNMETASTQGLMSARCRTNCRSVSMKDSPRGSGMPKKLRSWLDMISTAAPAVKPITTV